MAFVAAFASGPTTSCTVVAGDAPDRFRVTPVIAPVTVFEVLLMGTPSIVNEALVPPTGALKTNDVSLLLIANAPGVPVLWLNKARRAPPASLTTLAETPHF